MKTLEELTQEAEFAQVMVDHYADSEDSHRREANMAGAERLKWQRERDDIERQLISAQGEPS